MKDKTLIDLCELPDKELADLIRSGVDSYFDEVLATGSNQTGLIQLADVTISFTVLRKGVQND